MNADMIDVSIQNAKSLTRCYVDNKTSEFLMHLDCLWETIHSMCCYKRNSWLIFRSRNHNSLSLASLEAAVEHFT